MKICKKCGATFSGKQCKECKKIIQARFRLANKDHIKKYAADWYQNNKQKNKLSAKSYKNRNREKINSQKRESRKIRRNEIICKLFTLQSGKCPCCRLPLGKSFHLDHIIPIALGGLNNESNFQLLRSECNQQKHAKHPVDFMQERGFLL